MKQSKPPSQELPSNPPAAQEPAIAWQENSACGCYLRKYKDGGVDQLVCANHALDELARITQEMGLYDVD